MSEKFALKPRQTDALDLMEYNDFLGIGYKPGCGKTIIFLTWLYHALETGKVMRALIICPASMVDTWEYAIPKMLEFEGFTEEGVERVRKATTITSFQKTYKMDKVKHRKRDGTEYFTKEYKIRPELDREWGVIAVDESHCIGAHDSVQTKTCIKLATHAKYRYALTGTPVSGGGGKIDRETKEMFGGADYQKLFGQIMFLRPGIWKNWTEWTKKYVKEFDMWGKPFRYHEDSCKRLLENYFIFCTLDDMNPDIPEMVDNVIMCPLLKPAMYRDISKNRNLPKYGLDIESAGNNAPKLLQICSGSMKVDKDNTQVFETSKDEALRTILEGTDDKVVIFCNFRASVDRVENICTKYGKTVVYDGRSDGPTWREFQYGDARYLVCQYQSGGTGLDLFASSTMVLFEPTLSSLILEQTKARTHRTGQTKTCVYHYLTTPGTAEYRTLQATQRGYIVTNEMIQDWSSGNYSDVEFEKYLQTLGPPSDSIDT